MKWNKAISLIEQALQQETDEYRIYVEIHYHRKWMKNDAGYGFVYSISEYQWKDQICKAINTGNDQLLESMHIVDHINVIITNKQ